MVLLRLSRSNNNVYRYFTHKHYPYIFSNRALSLCKSRPNRIYLLISVRYRCKHSSIYNSIKSINKSTSFLFAIAQGYISKGATYVYTGQSTDTLNSLWSLVRCSIRFKEKWRRVCYGTPLEKIYNSDYKIERILRIIRVLYFYKIGIIRVFYCRM